MTIQPYRRKAQFYETDQMAIIHHANYIRWMEEARVDFMAQMGFSYERTTALGIDIAVLGVSCEYKSMVRFGDTVVIETSITAMSASRMTIAYRMFDSETNALRTIAHSQHCFVDSASKRPVSLKKAVPELYQILLQYCETE